MPQSGSCVPFRRSLRYAYLFVFILFIFAPPEGRAQGIRVSGQDTLILLGQKWREFMRLDDPRIAASISVEGGNTGLKALASQSVDIVQTRSMLDTSAAPTAIRVPVAVEAIAVFVNDANPVRELTLTQLKEIYGSAITNWKDVGGRDVRIELYAGESTTAIQEYFQQAVLKGEESFYVGKATTKAMLEVISRNPNAIGYSSLGAAQGVHTLRIRKSERHPPVQPTPETIRTLQYPISRYVYWYLARNPREDVRRFSQWVYSPHGQLVAEAVGFFPLLPEDRTASLTKLGLR